MLSVLAAIGIMSALNEEGQLIVDHMNDKQIVEVGCHQFTTGTFEKTPVVFALSGVGKVSAAVTATLLITKFNVDEIIFTGVAGGGENVEIGDVVIGHTYLQHDVDIRPIFPQFYLFSLDKQALHADPILFEELKGAAEQYFATGISFPDLNIHSPKVREGVIVSGDQFIFNPAHHVAIAENVKSLLPGGFHAIEMEGASVAQVCHEIGVPFCVIRAISDKADSSAPVNFQTFTEKVARIYSFEILKNFIHHRELSHSTKDK